MWIGRKETSTCQGHFSEILVREGKLTCVFELLGLSNYLLSSRDKASWWLWCTLTVLYSQTCVEIMADLKVQIGMLCQATASS